MRLAYISREQQSFTNRNWSASAVNLHAMRMGPGKHLQGRTLMNGLVKPEEFDYFHEVKLSKFRLPSKM